MKYLKHSWSKTSNNSLNYFQEFILLEHSFILNENIEKFKKYLKYIKKNIELLYSNSIKTKLILPEISELFSSDPFEKNSIENKKVKKEKIQILKKFCSEIFTLFETDLYIFLDIAKSGITVNNMMQYNKFFNNEKYDDFSNSLTDFKDLVFTQFVSIDDYSVDRNEIIENLKNIINEYNNIFFIKNIIFTGFEAFFAKTKKIEILNKHILLNNFLEKVNSEKKFTLHIFNEKDSFLNFLHIYTTIDKVFDYFSFSERMYTNILNIHTKLKNRYIYIFDFNKFLNIDNKEYLYKINEIKILIQQIILNTKHFVFLFDKNSNKNQMISNLFDFNLWKIINEIFIKNLILKYSNLSYSNAIDIKLNFYYSLFNKNNFIQDIYIDDIFYKLITNISYNKKQISVNKQKYFIEPYSSLLIKIK
ncbi:hypothetical protein [Mycoplasma leonicaptivi]|uniref:hypothetical protein n=1 Tax=Mycoplasma leonicaptivi TaxID=36742 RepID=UPI000482A600|nr:hypothetical protein [Mycoplasma leonicaptivi]